MGGIGEDKWKKREGELGRGKVLFLFWFICFFSLGFEIILNFFCVARESFFFFPQIFHFFSQQNQNQNQKFSIPQKKKSFFLSLSLSLSLSFSLSSYLLFTSLRGMEKPQSSLQHTNKNPTRYPKNP